MAARYYIVKENDQDRMLLVVDRKTKETLYATAKRSVAQWLADGLNKENRTVMRRRRAPSS